MIYLDHAATTPISKEAIEAWLKTSEHYFANTESLHEDGEQARQLLYSCKKELVRVVNGESEAVYFTGSGSEANLLALESLYKANQHKGNHVITSSIEHPSVLSFFQRLENQGVDVTYLPVQSDGTISLNIVENALREDTVLASIQHVNSEIGVIQPIKRIGQLLRHHHVIFHSDCVQSFGKIPLDLEKVPVDAITISSHKIYGPKGVGAVMMNKDTSWQSVHPLTSHQHGFRHGTIDLPGIAAFTTAAAHIHERMDKQLDFFWTLRTYFLGKLKDCGIHFTVDGGNNVDTQLPSILAVSIVGIEGQLMMQRLDRYQISISTGSACQSGKQNPSRTMVALQKNEQEIHRYFRLSFGKNTTKAQLDELAKRLVDIVQSVTN
ncbi:IscS subfamily cysteine desulfurase [Bacillus sp. FJAT-45037]|uniref:IscS subfamily cysteine desulfurase n=1 Tax=Bacillus sp. FJAT-45037 TaxID=2011007 RepID=UPI000C24821E|nr:IscS subfamily cysteine desulfurase [Bacillus sp. FJAT-45037]